MNLQWIAVLVGFACLYAATAVLGLSLLVQPHGVAAAWPASGLILGSLLIAPKKFRSAIMLGMVAGNVYANMAHGDKNLPISLAFSGINLGEGVLGAWLLGRSGKEFGLFGTNDLKRFFLYGGLVPPLIGGVVAGVLASSAFEGATLGNTAWLWFCSVSLGTLTVTPLVLCVGRRSPPFKLDNFRLAEFSILISASTLLVWFTFYRDISSRVTIPGFLYGSFPILLWAAVRFGIAGASAISLLITLGAIHGTCINLGVFQGLPGHFRVEALQLYSLIALATPLVIASILADRDNAERKLNLTQFAVDHASIAVIWVGRDAKMRYVNEATGRLLGYDPKDLIGMNVQVFDPTWPTDRWDDVWEMLKRARPTTFERKIQRKDGSPLDIEVVTTFITFNNEELYVAYVRDITDKKSTEEALVASENQARLLFEEASDGIFVADPNGNYIDVNRSGCRLLGYSREEILAKSISSLIAPEEIDSRPLQLDALREGGSLLSYRTMLHKDGSRVPVEISAKRLPNGNFQGIVRNIAERLRAENAIRESLALTQRVVESLPCGVFRISQEGIIQFANNVAAEFVRSTPDELNGKSVGDLKIVVLDDAGSTYSDTKAILQGVITSHSLRSPVLLGGLFSDGTTQWALTSATPFENPFTGQLEGYMIAFVDVTRQRESEQALRTSEARLRLLVENLPILFWTTDHEGNVTSMTGRLLMANHKPSISAVFGPENADRVRETSVQSLKLGLQALDLDVGDRVWSLRIEPFSLNELDIDGTVGLAFDITERKEAERAMQSLNTELERRVADRTGELAQTVRDLESFTYSVSHDLRAPLRAVAGYAHILREDYPESLPTDARDFLARIEANAKRMGTLIDDLLRLSRSGRQPIEKRSVDTGELVAGLLRDRGEEWSGTSFAVGTLPSVYGDVALLRQVFSNLLENAVKFSRHADSPEVSVNYANGAFVVSDNGTGFDMAYQDKLFGVFSRLHSQEEFEGSGVGLAIVQRIIQRHGGRVWLESEPGKGTKAFFTIPD
ncbi:MAG TPA: PAS domain S-box protein [Fimbriimonadaceae bacterium]|nr:PAS domain S-box protein [Fimbriimonadaceae bacterium]